MKRYTYYILAALLAFVSQTAQAQTEQDALYIYRNDGGFNAFFFDDIDYFEYSCIDTLGVEHDDYVTQEVHALDSIFRIPLTAIDSIAFVTPETVYKEDIIKIDKSIAGHVIASDSVNWIRVDNSTPENLIPKKGDKILITETNRFMPEGFGGRVTSVDKTTAGTTITTEALPIEEAFESAMFKMAVNTEADSQASTRGDEPIISTDGPVALGPYIGVAGLTGSKELINGLDIFSVSATPLGAIRYEISPTINYRAFLTFNKKDGVHIASYANIDGHINVHAKLEGTLSARLDVPFPKVGSFYRLTYNSPDDPVYFKGLFKVGLFVEGTAMITLDGGFDGEFHAASSLGYIKPTNGDGRWINDNDASFVPKEYGVEYGFGDFTFSTGAFFECSLDFKHPLIKGVNGFGLRAELGDKFTLQSVALSEISDDLLETYGYMADYQIYDLLDKDDIIKSDLYFSIDPYVKSLGGQSTKFKKTADLYSWHWGVVPEIKNFDAVSNRVPWEVTAQYNLGRKLARDCKVGLAVFETYGLEEYRYWRPDTYSNERDNLTVKQSFIIDPLPDANASYYFYPMVSYLDKPILYYDRVYFDLDTAYVDTPEKIELLDKDETRRIYIATNIPDVIFYSSATWLDVDWEQDPMYLYLKHGTVPDNQDSRNTTVSLIAKNSKGEVLIEREVPVIQKADPDRIKFTVSPTPIDVPGYSTEFQNGHLTKQFTVTYPRSATALTVTSSDDSWLTADNGGGIGSGSNTCNISIKANTSLKNSRKGTITVLLTKSDGSTDTKTITVNQSAMSIKVEAIPNDITLEAQKDEESDVSDTKTVNIKITPYDDFIASLIKDQNVTPNAEWIHYNQNGTAIQIWADANPVDESRDNTVTYTLTLTTGDVITSTIKVTQLKPEGDPSVIDAGGFHFSAKEGDQTITISEPNVERILKVDAPYDSWIGVAGSGLKLTVTVKENTTPNERIGLVKVTAKMKDGTEATLFYQVTQDAGAGFGEISSIDLYVKVAESTTYDDGETYAGKYQRNATVSTDKGEITTTPKGLNGLHVVCTQTIDDWHLYNYTVTFDIDDIYGLQSRTAQILNLKFHLTEDEQSATEIGHGEEGISIPSIPMNGENQWGGTAGDGVEFNSFVDKYHSTTYNEEGEVSYSYSRSSKLVNSSDNTVRIKLNFR